MMVLPRPRLFWLERRRRISTDDSDLPLTMEFQDPSWHVDEVFAQLAGAGAALCTTDLPEDVRAARKWLAMVVPDIAFNDGRRLASDRDAAVTLALGARGLKRLGLPEQGLATFPFAFLEGMTTPARARILGDFDKNASETWIWGRSQPDVALLIYGTSAAGVGDLARVLIDKATTLGMGPPHEIPLKKVTANLPGSVEGRS